MELTFEKYNSFLLTIITILLLWIILKSYTFIAALQDIEHSIKTKLPQFSVKKEKIKDIAQLFVKVPDSLES